MPLTLHGCLALVALLCQQAPGTDSHALPCLRVIETGKAHLNSLDVAGDGKRFATGSELGQVLVYSLPEGTLEKEIGSDRSPVMDVEFDARSEQLLAVQYSGAHVWKTDGFALLQSLSGQKLDMLRGCFSPDGRSVATGSCGNPLAPDEDTEACVWEIATGKRLTTVGGLEFRVCVSFRPDGSALLATSESNTSAYVQPLGEKSGLVRLEANAGGLAWSAWSPDGKTVLTASSDNNGRLWNADTGKLLHVLRGHEGYLLHCQFTPDGKEALTTSWADRTTRVWNVKTGKQRLVLSGHSDRPTAIRVSPDGRTLASFDFAGQGILFRLADGKRIGNCTGHSQCVSDVAFTPDSMRILSSSFDGSVRIWGNPLAR